MPPADSPTSSPSHSIQVGDVLEGLGPELVEVTTFRPLGQRWILGGVTVETRRHVSRPFTAGELAALTVKRQGSTGFTYDGNGEAFLLGAEAERVRAAFQFDPLFAVNASIVDPLPHQIEAVYEYLLPLPRIRFLLADDTGAGKTIMAGLLLRELFFREVISRVLIVTPGGLTKQWQEEELAYKFGLSFDLVDRARFHSSPNVFNDAHLCVTSIDFLRQPDALDAAKAAKRWDLVIVDEAHKLSAYQFGQKIEKNRRYAAIEALSERTDHLLLLTATPHRGRKDTFRYLMKLLDADLFEKDERVTEHVAAPSTTEATIAAPIVQAKNRFFLRRLKEDMVDWAGQPLFKPRHTKTIGYDLTPEELDLYTRVTKYVRTRRRQAKETGNLNVELALMVLQRRLASSLYAVTVSLERRRDGLQELLAFIRAHPDLDVRRMFEERQKTDAKELAELGADGVLDPEAPDLDDEQQKRFEKIILAKTVSTDPEEIAREIADLEELIVFAHTLDQHEETKYFELKKLLDENDVMRDEKLVIFTEYKDTLDILARRLRDGGYEITTIDGSMDVDARKLAQRAFAGKAQILIATDAAGEGINLQFCRFLINWDVPWNPNRLEQRMGRIHRYGQKHEVLVSNLIAQNTREGYVLQTILKKLEVMREQLDTDRVYDVIDELLDGVPLRDLMERAAESDATAAAFGREDAVSDALRRLNADDDTFTDEARGLIEADKASGLTTEVRWKGARALKEQSDERRLQPLYVERFFRRAFTHLGGTIGTGSIPGLLRIAAIPEGLRQFAAGKGWTLPERPDAPFTFDKSLLGPTSTVRLPEGTRLLGPGHPLFDAVRDHVLHGAADAFARGVTLIDPTRTDGAWGWVVRSRICDGRTDARKRIADELLGLVVAERTGLQLTSPAYLLELTAHDGAPGAADAAPHADAVLDFTLTTLGDPQLARLRDRRQREAADRRGYLDTAFTDLIADRSSELADLEGRELRGENTYAAQDDLRARIDELKTRKAVRLEELALLTTLEPETPEILGALRIVPLPPDAPESARSNPGFFLHRDDEVERIAMEATVASERGEGREPEDVASDNVGYDVRSRDPRDETRRYIEVKGRAQTGDVLLSENELNRLRQLKDAAWLYVVTNCRETPEIHRIQDPGHCLSPTALERFVVQHRVDEKDWRTHVTPV